MMRSQLSIAAVPASAPAERARDSIASHSLALPQPHDLKESKSLLHETPYPPARVRRILPSANLILLDEDEQIKVTVKIDILNEMESPVRVSITTQLQQPLIEIKEHLIENESDADEDEEHKPQSKCHKIAVNLSAFAFTAALGINSVAEIDDALESTKLISLFPCPRNPLAFIPNTEVLQYLVAGGLFAYTFQFDLKKLEHGLNTIIHSKGKIPKEWSKAWKKRKLSPESLKKLVGICLAIGCISIIGEILISINISKDIDQPKTEEDNVKLAAWLNFPYALNMTTSFIGNIAFIFCEVFRLPEVAVYLITKNRGMIVSHVDPFTKENLSEMIPYPRSYELVSLLPRIAGAFGSTLFAMVACSKVLSIESTLGKASLCLFLNSEKGLTSLAYDGEYTLEVLARYFNMLSDLRQGKLPSLVETLSAGIAIPAAGIIAYLQQILAEKYFKELEAPEVVNDYLLGTIALLWAYQMWVNYAGSFYDPIYNLLNGISSRLTNFCGRTPHSNPSSETDEEKGSATPYILLSDEEKYNERKKTVTASQTTETLTVPSAMGSAQHRSNGWFARLRRKICGPRPSEQPAEDHESIFSSPPPATICTDSISTSESSSSPVSIHTHNIPTSDAKRSVELSPRSAALTYSPPGSVSSSRYVLVATSETPSTRSEATRYLSMRAPALPTVRTSATSTVILPATSTTALGAQLQTLSGEAYNDLYKKKVASYILNQSLTMSDAITRARADMTSRYTKAPSQTHTPLNTLTLR